MDQDKLTRLKNRKFKIGVGSCRVQGLVPGLVSRR